MERLIIILKEVLGFLNEVNRSTIQCLHTPQELRENTGSGDYERREKTSMNADEEKVVGLDGTSHLPSYPGETSTTACGLSSSWPSDHNRSLKTIRSYHSRAGADGHTCFDTEPSPNPPSKSNADGTVAEEPYLVT